MAKIKLILCLSVLLLILTLASFLDMSNAYTINLSTIHLPPSLNFIGGTDQLGRDVFLRSLLAAKNAILFAAIAWIVSLTLGVILGMVAGLTKRRLISTPIAFCIQLCFVTPFLLILVSVSSFFGYSKTVTLIVVFLLIWAWPARLTKGLTEHIYRQSHNRISETMGLSQIWRIKYLYLPQIIPVICLSSGPLLVEIIAIDIIVNLFGFGNSLGIINFGQCIKEGIDNFYIAHSSLITPVLLLCAVSFCFKQLFINSTELLSSSK